MKPHLSWMLLSLLSASVIAGEWPAWRGPEGMGVAAGEKLPLRWGTNENVRWKIPLPERGNSTPIVWKDRIFLTQTIGDKRALLCLDRKNGNELWRAGPTFAEQELTHETNPQSSSSPVTDGERVIAWFGSAGLYCYDLNGKELWQRDLGRQRHIWGMAHRPFFMRICAS